MKVTFFSKIICLIFILNFFSTHYASSQRVYASEGINMPGTWTTPIWENPPKNLVLASSEQSLGGKIVLIDENLAQPHFQSIFSVAASGGDLVGGTYEYKFSSGPLDKIWNNTWGGVATVINQVQSYTYQSAIDNSITIANGKYYVMNFNDNLYTSTKAIFMELSAYPVTIGDVSYSPIVPQANEEVTVNVSISANKSPEEKVYLRYTKDSWLTFSLVEFTFSATEGTAKIPGFPDATKVDFYVFSTTISNPTGDFDLITIDFNNNLGNNYSYTVGQEVNCGSDIALILTVPSFPQESESITIRFNATLGNGALAGYDGDVYAHTGVITSASSGDSDWKYIVSTWGANTEETKFTKIGGDLYELTISDLRSYYNVPIAEDILKIAMVIRSGEPINIAQPTNFYVARNTDGTDILIPIYSLDLNVKILSPSRRDALVQPNTLLPICVEALEAEKIDIYVDKDFVYSQEGNSITYGLATHNLSPGLHWVKAFATKGEEEVKDSVSIYIRGLVNVAPLPEGITGGGIHYDAVDKTKVTLVLHDPAGHKEFAFVIGDFNGWSVCDEGYMNRTADGLFYWKTISNLTSGKEYAYQYYIDGELKIADPYTEKVLDPWNDKWIPDYNYPNLIDYPNNYATDIVSVLQTGKTEYQWLYSDNFIPQAQGSTHKNLIIYELHIRDFVSSRAIRDVTAKLDYLQELGVNAIELMPINEFEGNDSWGYNPSFYFAPDKAYGTETDYKQFIDECHRRDIAVIIDLVFNHSYRQSPFLLMYYDAVNDKPTSDNPYYNVTSPNTSWSWGYDFNHESLHTKKLVKDVCSYWINEYKIDGFRFDFTKGFTNTPGDGWNYDQTRVNILNEYNSHIYSAYNNNTTRYPYVILEHLADNSEESALAAADMMLWTGQALNSVYNQATMGFESNSNFSSAYYGNRGWSNANLVQYMESHDEERMMYRNLLYGNYTKTLENGVKHTKTVVPLFMLIPGAKMIWQFQELGYDISIDDPCRICPKPIHWEYYDDPYRKDLYNTFSMTANLIETSEIFEGNNTSFSSDLAGNIKKMWLSNGTTNMVVAANISGTTPYTFAPGFHANGTWHEYYSNTSLEVTDNAGHTVTLEPGEFKVWTSKKVAVKLNFIVKNNDNNNAVDEAVITLSNQEVVSTDASGVAEIMVKLNQTIDYTVTKDGYELAEGTLNVTDKDIETTILLKPTVNILENKSSDFTVYPNPNQGHFQLFSPYNAEANIYDIAGRNVRTVKIIRGTNYLDLSELKKGIYIINLSYENNNSFEKIIIN